MKGIIRKSSITLLAACLLLTGCGESMQALNAEEESIVVAYASGAVGKANKHQAKGMLYAVPQVQEEEETEEPPQQKTVPQEETDTQTPQGGVADTVQEPQKTTATLTDALGMSPITAEYKGFQVDDHYVLGDYFSMDANMGNRYIMVNIALTNPSDQPVDCNILEKKITCQLTVNGEEKSRSLATMLPNDFSIYVETLQANTSVDTLLFFEVKSEEAENIQSLSMNFIINGNEYNINLQ